MRRVLAFVLAAAGCSGPGTMATPVDGPAGDVTPGSPGLFITWLVKPPVPGPVTAGLTIDSVTMKVRNLRAIGDAGNNDPRTAQDESTVVWSMANHPAVVAFRDAPTGLYSKVSFELDGQLFDSSFDVQGTVVVAGQTKRYDIHDRDETNVSGPLQLSLAPGGHADVQIALDLGPALGTIDFATLSEDEGTLECDNSDAQIGAFRTKLHEGFSIGTTLD